MAVRLSARHSLDLLLLHGSRGVGVVLLGRGDRLRVALGEALEPRQLGHIAAGEACCLKRRAAFFGFWGIRLSRSAEGFGEFAI